MKFEIKGKPGLPAIRYLRSDYDRERIQKVFLHFGRDAFTMRDLKSEILPDTNSGEICKWDSTRIIECVGKTPQTRTESSAKIWRLSESVVHAMNYHSNGEL